jgi:catechol 2,3-dioxygenase-like lactoylglutathione lyase family enzyme
MSQGVVRLRRIGLVVADLASATRFYADSFGFVAVKDQVREGADIARLFGRADLRETSRVLRLGREEIELVSCDPRGQPYPTPRSAADPWFQHFAIAVADMDRVYATLTQAGEMSPITTGGPQRLPPNTGGVTAYKFRDPEGHPLELSMFPPGVGAARWQARGRAACLGVDHSAIAVADLERSEAFYAGLLGLDANFRTVNRGLEQDRLDGLHSDGVGIVALQPADPDSPHIELLHYPAPSHAAAAPAVNDIAATRLTLEVGDLDAMVARLQAAGVVFVSPSIVVVQEMGERAALVRDPDGHLLMLCAAA